MFTRLIVAIGLALLIASPAAADECARDLSKVNAALSKPKAIKAAQADMSADVILKAVGIFVEQAEADQKAGKDKACATRLVAAKKILNIE